MTLVLPITVTFWFFFHVPTDFDFAVGSFLTLHFFVVYMVLALIVVTLYEGFSAVVVSTVSACATVGAVIAVVAKMIADNNISIFFFICFNSFVFFHYIIGLHTRQENIKKDIVSAIEMFTFVYFLKNEDVMSLILLMFSVSVVFESPMSHYGS